VYPDRAPDGLGTLFIPNTLALIRGAPDQEAARALADHLLSPEVEAMLANGPSAPIPLLKGTQVPARGEAPHTGPCVAVDFGAAAKVWDEVAAFLASEFASN